MPLDDGALRFETHLGAAIRPYVRDVAALRLEGFRAFPYLYEGTLAYEESYLAAYADAPRSMLIRVLAGGQLAAVATATPLCSSSEIVAEGPECFRRAGTYIASHIQSACIRSGLHLRIVSRNIAEQ